MQRKNSTGNSSRRLLPPSSLSVQYQPSSSSSNSRYHHYPSHSYFPSCHGCLHYCRRHRPLLLRFLWLGVCLFLIVSLCTQKNHNKEQDLPLQFDQSQRHLLSSGNNSSSVLRRPATAASSQNNHDRQAHQQQQRDNSESSKVQQQLPEHSFSVISPHQQLQQFLHSSATLKTAGHHYISLLQTNLYDSLDNRDELDRLQACHANPHSQRLSNTNLCFAGSQAHQAALAALQQQQPNTPTNQIVRYMTNRTYMEQMTRFNIKGPDGSSAMKSLTVYDLQRYGPDTTTTATTTTNNNINTNIADQLIPNLGTPLACLPLVLAGLAVAATQTAPTKNIAAVAELGPYFGLSSKCLVSGLSSLSFVEVGQQPQQPPFYVAYDTFEGLDNLKSLQHQDSTRWILEDYFSDLEPRALTDTTTDHSSSTNNTSFLFLWKRAVLPVYPHAQAVAGRLDPTHNDDPAQETNVYQLLSAAKAVSSSSSPQQHQQPPPQDHTLSLLVIDSIKTAKSWNQQLEAVLGSPSHLSKGTILILMDFEFVGIQVKQLYGCLRPYLLPVYISWNQEHWAFVVVTEEGVDLMTHAHRDCYAKIAMSVVGSNADTSTTQQSWMEDQVAVDLQFVSSGLKPEVEQDTTTSSSTKSDTRQKWADVRTKLLQHMVQNLRDKPEQWAALAAL